MEKRIIEGALRVVEKKGSHFTMGELATELGMSKKTIYTVFRDKNSLLIAMVDYVFDRIKESERAVMEEENLSLQERIRKILGVMPETFQGLEFSQLYLLQDKYPKMYQRVQERLESDWEMTLSLIREGIDQGIVRPVNFRVFQIAFEATTERFLVKNELAGSGISYMEALDELVRILVDGILIKKD